MASGPNVYAKVSDRDAREPREGLLLGERVLVLAEIADLLGCSEAEAIRFVIRNDLPYFTLPSGRMRFLASAVADALRALTQKRPTRLNSAARQARVRKAWESWIINQGIDVVECADVELKDWIEQLIDREVGPSDLMSLDVNPEKDRGPDARMSGLKPKAPETSEDHPYRQQSSTTIFRNHLSERKKFE